MPINFHLYLIHIYAENNADCYLGINFTILIYTYHNDILYTNILSNTSNLITRKGTVYVLETFIEIVILTFGGFI